MGLQKVTAFGDILQASLNWRGGIMDKSKVSRAQNATLDVWIKLGDASTVFSTSNLRYSWHAVLLHILVLCNMASSDEEAGINELHGNTNLSGLEEISFA